MIRSVPKGWTLLAQAEDGFAARSSAIGVNVQASWGDGWDHVSVSRVRQPRKVPSYRQMRRVHEVFFPFEVAFELHMPRQRHLSPASKGGVEVLHLWRPQRVFVPTPPVYML